MKIKIDHRRNETKEPYSHEDQTMSKQWKSYGSTWKWDTSEESDTTAMWQDVGIQQSVTQQDALGEDEECVYENTPTTALNRPGGSMWQEYQVDKDGKRFVTPCGLQF